MKQRGSFSITTLILLTLRDREMTKTKLMQNLTLSYRRVQSYCDTLLQKGLIQYNPETHVFSLTPRGTKVLALSEELAGYLSPVESMIHRYSHHIEEAPEGMGERNIETGILVK